MSFESDLVRIIKQRFDKVVVDYDNNMGARGLAKSYLEMLKRIVVPNPRCVHFSEEIHVTLGDLSQKADMEQQEVAADAWIAVFLIRYLLVKGENVKVFLSKRIRIATGEKSRDRLLWDFGMHHFHLRTKLEASGFIKRSDYLLFAIINKEHAYFVDVRPHQEKFLWVRQDLLKIVHSNWPELIESNILRGVKGTVLTDEELAGLREKGIKKPINRVINHAPELGGNAIAPLGGGMMLDGSSLLCEKFAAKLLHEIKRHQNYFDTNPSNLRSALEDKGMEKAGGMEFELVLLDDLNRSEELIDSLRAKQCLSRDLCEMGFAVVERTTRLPIVVSLEEEP